ncbi:MAG: hypothetical protein PHW04_03595 [Candidatus Wallbacteria bacterium]|nr:hypothetical protein [Candidatus Wallbacteria bacterium]
MDNLKTEKDIDAFYTGINDLIKAFQKHPFDFLYERDLQAFLYYKLYKKFREDRVEIGGGCYKPMDYGGGKSIQTALVHCEYPCEERFKKMDVVLIDRNYIIHYDKLADGSANDPFWRQPIRAAVELKYLMLGDIPAIRFGEKQGIKRDVEKLKKYREEKCMNRPFLGISILFIQPINQKINYFNIGQEIENSNHPSKGLFVFLVKPDEFVKFEL